MRVARSCLYIPGHRAAWVEGAAKHAADIVVLDLEDSVPVSQKRHARDALAAAIPRLAAQGQRIYVRINRGRHIYDFDDVLAVTRLGLEGIVIPKILSDDDLGCLNGMLREAEERQELPVGETCLLATLETAWSLQNADAIARRPYISGLIGASAKNADVARSVGFNWTKEGFETLYFRSRVVLAARANGKFAIGGLWQDVHDLDGLKIWAQSQRNLGFSGEIALHPSNVPIINAAFSPSHEELGYYRRMVAAFEAAEAKGIAAVNFEGEHIDYAHYNTAKALVAAEAGRDAQSGAGA